MTTGRLVYFFIKKILKEKKYKCGFVHINELALAAILLCVFLF